MDMSIDLMRQCRNICVGENSYNQQLLLGCFQVSFCITYYGAREIRGWRDLLSNY
ncbi:hypothetical protein NPIL_23951, partial [Nephila pilipes]